MTTVSDTDLQVFANLANPSKANVSNINDDEVDMRSGVSEKSHVVSDDDERAISDDDNRSEKSEVSQHSSKSSKSKSSIQSKGSKASNTSKMSQTSQASSKKSSHISRHTNASERQSRITELHPQSTISRMSKTNNSETYSNASQQTNASQPSNINKPFQNYMNNTSHKKTFSELPSLSCQQTDDEMAILDKQQVLMDMERLKLQGVKLTRDWTLNDRLDDMQFEVKRHMLHIDEMTNINMMRDGMRLLCSGFEMINTKVGLLELNGWSNEVCQDMDKYNNALGRIYRKYWRKNNANSPETEILFGLVGSIGMFHFKQKMQKTMFKKSTQSLNPGMPNMPNRPPPAPSSTTRRPVNTSINESDSDSDSEESAPP